MPLNMIDGRTEGMEESARAGRYKVNLVKYS